MNTIINLNKGISIEILESVEREFLGIGKVTANGIQLRSTERPFVVRIDTPDGIFYTRLFIETIKANSQKAVINFKAYGIPWIRGEYLDECNQGILHPEVPVSGCIDSLKLIIESQELILNQKEFIGFSYSFEFSSKSQKIHRLLTHATWELDESIVGNTFLNQGQVNMPAYYGDKNSLFTTTCLKTLGEYGIMKGYSFQLGPRGGLIQGFDFQYNDSGILMQYWPKFGSISSLVESPPGSEIMHILDEYRQELSCHLKTPPKHVLFCKGNFEKYDCRNTWWHTYQLVYNKIKKNFDLTPTVVMPEINPQYEVKVSENSLQILINKKAYFPKEVLYAIGDNVMPILAKNGIKRFFPEVMSQSDVTERGMKRKIDDGVHGDLHCSSVCATHRFLPAEFWGGMEAWRYMADQAHKFDIEIGSWFSPHFSPNAEIFKEHPDWLLTDVNTLRSGSGYGINTVSVADWNTGIYQWVLEDIKRWKEEGGLDFLFTDSFVNQGLVQQNYAKGMRTNFDALGRLYSDFQKIGIKDFSFESISPFGISRFGVQDMRSDLLDTMSGVPGQNDFEWWINEEDMFFNVCAQVVSRKRKEGELKDIQFRAMANKGYVFYHETIGVCHNLPEWHSEHNHIYNQVVKDMQNRFILPNNQGVSWTNGNITILWSFKPMEFKLDLGSLLEVIQKNGPKVINSPEILITKPHTVYRIIKK